MKRLLGCVFLLASGACEGRDSRPLELTELKGGGLLFFESERELGALRIDADAPFHGTFDWAEELTTWEVPAEAIVAGTPWTSAATGVSFLQRGAPGGKRCPLPALGASFLSPAGQDCPPPPGIEPQRWQLASAGWMGEAFEATSADYVVRFADGAAEADDAPYLSREEQARIAAARTLGTELVAVDLQGRLVEGVTSASDEVMLWSASGPIRVTEDSVTALSWDPLPPPADARLITVGLLNIEPRFYATVRADQRILRLGCRDAACLVSQFSEIPLLCGGDPLLLHMGLGVCRDSPMPRLFRFSPSLLEVSFGARDPHASVATPNSIEWMATTGLIPSAPLSDDAHQVAWALSRDTDSGRMWLVRLTDFDAAALDLDSRVVSGTLGSYEASALWVETADRVILGLQATSNSGVAELWELVQVPTDSTSPGDAECLASNQIFCVRPLVSAEIDCASAGSQGRLVGLVGPLNRLRAVFSDGFLWEEGPGCHRVSGATRLDSAAVISSSGRLVLVSTSTSVNAVWASVPE